MIVPEVHFDCPNCGARLGVIFTPEAHGVPISRIERTGICARCRKGVAIRMEIATAGVPEKDLHPESRDVIAEVVRKKFDGADIPPDDHDVANYLRCFTCGFVWHRGCMNGDIVSCPSCQEEECRLQQVVQTSEIYQANHLDGCPYDKKAKPETPQE